MRDEFDEAMQHNFNIGVAVGIAGILFLECIGWLAYAIVK